MNKAILGVSVLVIGIGIGTYFYLSGTEEVRVSNPLVEPKVAEEVLVDKNKINKTVVKKEKELKKKRSKRRKTTRPEFVNGYLLPPEPDKVLNDSTLLGIDSNKNMLRDDIERWVVKQPWSHQRIAAALQSMRGFQALIDESIGSYGKRATLSDIANYALDAKRNDPMLSESKEFRARIFNTPERKKAYRRYDSSFSGTMIHAIPNSGKFSYKYADYTMEDGKLSSYKFNNEMYYSEEDIPLYSSDNGLITSFWSLEENQRKHFEGNWNDKYCEINFGIPKNNIECGHAKIKYKNDIKAGIIK